MKEKFLSYGAGMQTFALLVMAEQGEIEVDEVIFADTGAEHPQTYKHIETVVKPICNKINVPFTVVHMSKELSDIENLAGDELQEYKTMLKNTEKMPRNIRTQYRREWENAHNIPRITVNNLRDEIIKRRRVPSINPQSRWCLPPNQRIVTSNGLCPISEVKIGDLVLTKEGRYKPITNIYVRKYDGKLVKLRPKGYGGNVFDTYLTPEHEIFVRDLGYKRYEGVGEHTITEGRWVKSNDVKGRNMVLSYPRLKEVEDLDIDRRYLKLFGYYLAEGYISDRIYFTFGKNLIEASYAQETYDILKELGYTPKLYFYKTGYVVTVFGKKNGLVSFIKRFGTDSHTKRIPLWVKRLPTDKLSLLLQSYLDGDGHLMYEEKNNRAINKATTVSLQLAWDIRDIALKLGNRADIYTRKNDRTSNYKGRIIQGQTEIYEIRIWINSNQKALFRRYRFDDHYIAGKIWEREEISYTGNVYDIEVDEDHSFCAPAFIVSNCTSDSKLEPIRKYIKAEQSKDQYINPAIALIGLSYEELTRMYKPHLTEYTVNYPLIDKKMTRNDCVKYVRKYGYEPPNKSGCYFCPFQSKKEWGNLYRTNPDLYWDAVNLEETDLNYPTYRLYANGKPLRKLAVYFSSNSKQTTLDDNDKRDAMPCEMAGFCHI